MLNDAPVPPEIINSPQDHTVGNKNDDEDPKVVEPSLTTQDNTTSSKTENEGPSAAEPSMNTSGQVYRCECGKVCQRREGLSQHKKNCNVSEAVAEFSKWILYSCPQCDFPCTSSRALKMHSGSGNCIKRQAARSRSASLTLALSESENTKIEENKCQSCKTVFQRKKTLSSHVAKCQVGVS